MVACLLGKTEFDGHLYCSSEGLTLIRAGNRRIWLQFTATPGGRNDDCCFRQGTRKEGCPTPSEHHPRFMDPLSFQEAPVSNGSRTPHEP